MRPVALSSMPLSLSMSKHIRPLGSKFAAAMKLLPTALAACAIGLAVPGGTSFGVAVPAFILADAHFCALLENDDDYAINPDLRPAAGLAALSSAALLTVGEAAVGLDTGSQPAALFSFAASVGLSAGLNARRFDTGMLLRATGSEEEQEEEEGEDVIDFRRRKKEALSARKSWDARLSWSQRKRIAADAAAQDEESRRE